MTSKVPSAKVGAAGVGVVLVELVVVAPVVVDVLAVDPVEPVVELFVLVEVDEPVAVAGVEPLVVEEPELDDVALAGVVEDDEFEVVAGVVEVVPVWVEEAVVTAGAAVVVPLEPGFALVVVAVVEAG